MMSDREASDGRILPLNSSTSELDFDDEDSYTQGQLRVVREVPWSERIWTVSEKIWLRRNAICYTFVFLFFFIWYMSSTNNSCWAKMSPPYTNNRQFNSQPMFEHAPIVGTSAVSLAIDGKNDKNEVRFLVVGNFGRDGFCYQTDVAIEMERAARSMKAAFVINTGNAFFPSGIKSYAEEQVNTSWRNVYDTPSLSGLKWFSALGEAESIGDVSALLGFAKRDPFFVMDASYYDQYVYSKKGDVSLHIIVLDTPSLIRSKKKQNDEQLLWLSSKLSESNATMRLVVGYHTPFADQTLTTYLIPILERSDTPVTAYFSGRELTLQWFKQSAMDYFVSGGGAEMLKNENPFKYPSFVGSTPGFLACAAGFDEKTKQLRLVTAIVSYEGEVIKKVESYPASY